jgi:pimeloyl-ACP methyl ester carboxylesterase
MPLIPLVRVFFSLVSIFLLALAGYLFWSWYEGQVILDAAGVAVREREDWRLWTGAALVAWSLLGRFPMLLLLAKSDRDPTRAQRGAGQMIAGADGAHLYVEVHGPADAPTLILTHGWGLDSTIWFYARRALAGRYRVVTWDLPGMGRSKGSISLDSFAANLARVAAWADGPVILVGHSIGGMTIQTLLRNGEPATRDRIRGVVLLNTTYTNPLKTMIWPGLMTALRRPILAPMMRMAILLQPLVWLSAWQGYLNGSAHAANRLGFGRFVTRSQLDHNTLLATRNPPGASGRGNLAMFAWDATDAAADLNAPLLVIAGERDIVTKLEAGERIASSAPRGRLVRVAGVNHMGLLERHDLYNDEIAAFAAEAFNAGPTPTLAPPVLLVH